MMKNKGPKERIIHLKDLADVSESEKKVLSYFETARKLGASDIHFFNFRVYFQSSHENIR